MSRPSRRVRSLRPRPIHPRRGFHLGLCQHRQPVSGGSVRLSDEPDQKSGSRSRAPDAQTRTDLRGHVRGHGNPHPSQLRQPAGSWSGTLQLVLVHKVKRTNFEVAFFSLEIWVF